MRTSKKLLSLFLALVMIVTSCSVGFTAFAADGNQTDSNLNYWDRDAITSEDAFKTIEKLLDELLQLDPIKNVLVQNNLRTTSLKDVVEDASPLILKALGGSTSKESWLKAHYPDYEGKDIGRYNQAFSLVDGDGDDLFNFYSLYNFCEANKDAGGELGDYCKSTFDKLDELKKKCEALYNAMLESQTAINDIFSAADVGDPSNPGTAYKTASGATVKLSRFRGNATLYIVENSIYNGKALKDYTIDEARELLDGKDYYIDYYINTFKKIGLPNEIDSLAKVIFYTSITRGPRVFDSYIYMYLFNKAGVELKLTNGANTTAALTPQNVRDEVKSIYSGITFYNANTGTNKIVSSKITLAPYNKNDYRGDQFTESYAAYAVMNEAMGLTSLGDLSDNSGNEKAAAFHENYVKIADQLAIEGGYATAQEIEDAKITDKQIEDTIAIATSENWTDDSSILLAYLKSDKNVFSPAVTNYLISYCSHTEGNTVAFAKQLTEMFNANSSGVLPGAGSVDGVKGYVMNDSQYFLNGKTFKERMDYITSTALIAEKAGNDTSAIYEVNNPERTLYIAKFFASEVCNKKTYANEYDYSDYDNMSSEAKVYAANASLDSILSIVGDPTVSNLLGAILGSDLDLGQVLDNVWLELWKNPAKTVFNLLPTLMVVVDGLVAILLHDDVNDKTAIETMLGKTVEALLMEEGGLSDLLITIGNLVNSDLSGLAETLNLYKYSQAAGNTKIGLGALHIDLNVALPAILHYVTGDVTGAYTIIAQSGAAPTYSDPYDGRVLRFTNIYIVDGAIASKAGSPKALVDLIAGLIGGDTAKTLQQDGVYEIADELLNFLKTAVDEDLAQYKDEKRIGTDFNGTWERQNGLNNLMVSLPRLIDRLGKDFITKYNVTSDWAFAYSSASGASKQKIDANGSIGTYNTHVQAFKDLATQKDETKVLESVVDLLIGNWINALLDFLNDTLVEDDDNKLTNELPLIQGLLEALGGFGEKSVITDALNGLFQLKRKTDEASFTLETRSETGYVGFSNTSGYFLISNLQLDENRGLIPFISGIVNPGSKKANYNLKKVYSGVPLLAASSKANKSAAGTDYNKLLTKENKQAAQKLIDTLDELLSSLLENTSLNGFDWTSNENFLASAVSFAATYFGEQNTNDIVKLLNNYLYFVVGESKKSPSKNGQIGTKAKGGNLDKNKVYTSANLSNLVIQTYSLLENIIDYLFYNSQTGFLNKQDPNMLIADALYGIVSPDAVSVRLSDKYSDTAKVLQKKDFLNWNSFKVDINAANNDLKEYNAKDYLKFGFSKGDKEAFYDALGESLSGVAGILGALLTKSYTDSSESKNWYSEVLHPILSSLADATGASGVMSASAFNNATAPQQLIKGILTPVSNILSNLYGAPVTFLLNVVKGLGNVLKDSNISKILKGALDPINLHIDGLCNILDKDISNLSPTFAAALRKSLSGKISFTLPKKNIAVAVINKLLAKQLGFSLPNINWDKLANAGSPAEVLLLVYGYVVDTLLGSDLLTSLVDSLDPSISKILKNLSAAQILQVLTQVLKVVQSPTEIYWTFSQYASKLTNSFVYPKGVTASKANDAVDKLDQLVENVFPLLNSLGVTDIEGLEQIINDNLYTNENITAIAKALYGALSGNKTVVSILKAVNLDPTPKGLAKYLTDKSYGKTYKSAAKTLNKAKNWNKVKKLNWGFKNGSANAQTGFINGLAASLRPLNNILAVLLCEGKLDVSKVQIKKALKALSLSGSTVLKANKPEYNCTITYKLKNSMLTVTFQSGVKTINNKKTNKSVLKIDIDSIAKDLEDMLKNADKLDFGTNGYENAVIPILEAFMCKNVKTYKQYKADYKKAKDNLLIDILKPIGGFITKVANKPFDTLTGVLPNVAYFLDSNGLAQAVANLLAPITSSKGVMGVLKKNGIDIDKLIKSLTGKSLGKIVADLIGYKGKLTVSLTDLKKTNIQDIIVPILNNLVLKKYGIKLPTIDWAELASHGTIKVVKSAAKNSKGKYTTRRVIARKGETLVAVFRYIADTLIKNAKAIKKLLVGIDAIKKNATIKSVVECILDQIATAKEDDIVLAIFYLLAGEPTDKFFDYRNFSYKEYDFDWGELDEDFCRQLAPMLDGLIGGLLDGGLTGLVEKNLYTDELVGKLATGLYGAIEGVKISDKIGTLTDILAQTDIDMSTTGVANLLTDKDYGQQYPGAARTIANSGSWKSINAKDLKFGVKDRDSFLHALTAVLRPLFGVLDVLLNDSALNLFDLISIPGSDDYSSTIVPLFEALGVYNIKTQYEYREDIYNEYDSLLLDILNPLWDKVEDILAAPIETLGNILPNLALFFANGGLTQVIDNLLTPITALLDALRPIVDINELLLAINVDVPKLLKDKVGLNIKKFDIYDLQGTLNPVIGAENIVGTINSILKIVKIKGKPLDLELPDIDWFKLASCGEFDLDATSQAATLGSRISVKADEDQAFISVLRFLIETINYKGNYDKIVALVGGLIGGADDTIAGVVDQVFGLLQGDTDQVIKDLVDLLQQLAG